MGGSRKISLIFKLFFDLCIDNQKPRRVRFVLYVLIAFPLFLMGCAGNSFLAHPSFAQRAAQIKTVTLLPPRIDVYELGLIDTPKRIPDWSSLASENIVAAASLQLKSLGRFKLERVAGDSLSDAQNDEMNDVHSLLGAVTMCVQTHVQGAADQRLPEKQASFDYSLGTFNEIAKLASADAFLLLQGVDQVTSPGAKAWNTALLLTSVAAASTAGAIIFPFVNVGTTLVTASLVDSRTGDILWYRTESYTGRYDLRDSESAKEFVKKLFEGFPL